MEYEYTVNKIVTQGNKDFDTDEEARHYAARIRDIYQAQDPRNEHWFDYKVAGIEPDVFLLQVMNDGVMTWSKKYDCALDAVRAYERITDWGFAHYALEAVLFEPNGKVHNKIFKCPVGTIVQ